MTRRVCGFGLATVLSGLIGAAALAAADPLPLAITSLDLTPTGITLAWADAEPGRAYTVQTRRSLSDGLWLSRSDQRPWPVLQTEWTDSLLPAGQAQYYRVIAVPAADRGKVLTVSGAGQMTVADIEIFMEFAGIPVEPQYDVGIHKVVYETVDPWGGRTQASGALVVPSNAGRSLPLMSYQHGTLVLTNEAPSAINEQILPGIAFASLGYVVALPDLLGFGDSPGFHPYHHARSEATACVDQLRAVRTWCATNNVALNGQTFLIGYSQGGHATMALQRELETYHTDEFAVTASAPMAGAHDLSGVTAEDILSGRPLPNPYYLIFLLAAYQEVYHLTNELADLLAPPYDTTLPPLMNGATTSAEINAAMPADVRLILKPEVLAAFQAQPQHPLRVALRDNDLHHWTPAAPTRLYHCRGDQDVLFENSLVAYLSFQSRGATHVQLIDPDYPNTTAQHTDCVLPAFLLAKDWFETLRQ